MQLEVQNQFPEIPVSLITYLLCFIVSKPQFFIFSVQYVHQHEKDCTFSNDL